MKPQDIHMRQRILGRHDRARFGVQQVVEARRHDLVAGEVRRDVGAVDGLHPLRLLEDQ